MPIENNKTDPEELLSRKQFDNLGKFVGKKVKVILKEGAVPFRIGRLVSIGGAGSLILRDGPKEVFIREDSWTWLEEMLDA